jgi:pyruvate dehydrogenase E2 component (dihydrolipoamide acetyltransferase)
MNDDGVHLLTMPKWGLAMQKGQVVGWLIGKGAEIHPGSELLEIETEKVVSAIESTTSGVLRRQVAHEGDVVHVGGLLGVIAPASAADEKIDRMVADFQAHYVPEESDEEVDAPVLRNVEVLGSRINYLQRGEGSEASILIHGFGGDLNSWMFNHEALASGRSVFALDLPGHGSSSKKVEEGSVAEMAKTLAAFMDAVGVEKAHLVGHSMGGAIATVFAVDHPQRCLSLTLIASAGMGPGIDTEYIQGFVAATRRNEIRPHLEKLFADPRLITRKLVDDTLKYKRLDGVEPALRTIASQLCSANQQLVALRPQLLELKQPVLVLWGSEDRIIPASQATDLPANMQTEVLPGFGHMVHMEAASKVNKAISSFWESAK